MLKDLVLKNRSYRGYDENRKISREELKDMVEHARLTPSSVNKQPLKYYLAYTKDIVDKIQSYTHWAKALPRKVPYTGHYPTAFIVICQDKTISPALDAFLKDVGITAQTILLRATEMGLGGCMIGSFDKVKLHECLRLEEHIQTLLVVAIGKPDEIIVLEDVKDSKDTVYYRDEQDIHHVPKRKLEDILLDYIDEHE